MAFELRIGVGLGWLAFAVLAVGCGSSEEEIQAEFDAFVAKRDNCEVASDCELANLGCPLGCFVYVNSERVAEVEAKADELIADYETWGAHCDYECVGASGATCEEQRCVAK